LPVAGPLPQISHFFAMIKLLICVKHFYLNYAKTGYIHFLVVIGKLFLKSTYPVVLTLQDDYVNWAG
jgi:hypothetical protein